MSDEGANKANEIISRLKQEETSLSELVARYAGKMPALPANALTEFEH
ncbi:MAG: hypothetical protein WCB68_07305 [Pyrinomonadaceae bacterium]